MIVSYFFDCADGHMARKYNMTSKFGDYYVHISDIVKITLVLYSLYLINSNKFFKVIPIVIFMGTMMIIHMGYQKFMSCF